MNILLIDNFDSFTYNIKHAYEQLGASVTVVRNNKITLDQIRAMTPDLIVIGPGPGDPYSAGISIRCLTLAHQGIPIFGICLGHQAIGAFYGATIVRAATPTHGKTSPICHSGEGPFCDLPQGFLATRYHSLVIDPSTLPHSLLITAWTEKGEVMGICHREYPIAGVQFHPESAASERGLSLLANTIYQK